MATNSAREARRRKIMERGSDRLALITGRIQTLPPDLTPIVSSPSTPPEDNPESAFEAVASLVAQGTTEPTPPFPSSTEQSSVSESTPTEQSSVTESRQPLVSPTERSSALERRSVWSPKQLSSALAATEKTRVLCSAVFSVLVVLSCVGFPVLSNGIFRSFLGFRPLCLVLVTNATLVIARLLGKNQTEGRRGRSRSESQPNSGSDLAEQLGNTLEIGLMMKKLVDSVFMDCAVYAVILVCGLSVAQKFR